MRKRNLIAALVTAGLTLATTNLLTQEPGAPPPQPAQPGQDYKSGAKPSQDPVQPPLTSHRAKPSEPTEGSIAPACYQASRIIGLEVRTDTGDRLGKVQDLIVSVESEQAPFAIVRYGGALGLGGTRVAVPFKDFKLSEDHKMLTLATTQDQFVSASATPNGAWAEVANQDWAKDVDRFYGQPTGTGLSRFERQEMEPGQNGHEFVRNPAETKGANALLNQVPAGGPSSNDSGVRHADSEITTQVSKLIEQTLGAPAGQDIQATVEKGVVILKGKVASAELQQKLDDQIKAIPGVDRIDDQLTASAKKD